MTVETGSLQAILGRMADATSAPTRPHRSQRAAANLSKVPYLPGLDGMRALAVVAVMVYHANSEWLPGGFLGVEVFFVISGYLITLLLIAEHERTGTVRLGAFWMRRARRLLPALFLMLFLLLTYTWIFKSSTLGKLRGDMLAGCFYVSNWYQIWVGQGYTATGDFAPLRHLWSLGVEEQFYLRLADRDDARCCAARHAQPGAHRTLARAGGARGHGGDGAALPPGTRSATAQVTPEAYWTIGGRCISKADALYLSTITRSRGLLLGGAFAMVWRPVAIMRGPLRDAAGMLDLVAVVGLALLLGCSPGRSTSSRPTGPTRGCSAAGSCGRRSRR